MKPKHTVTWMMPFAEAKALMDEFCGTVPWVGSVPTLEETQHLAEETDEIAEEEEDRLTTRPTRRVGSRDKPQRREQEMAKDQKPEQQQEQPQETFTISAALVPRDQLVAELKAKFPGITDEELEAFGV
jgi:hypothetical protein